MEKLDLSKQADLLDSSLVGLLVGRFYITVRSRNAWHNTTSRVYQGEASLNMTIETARIVAEDWRKQGSQFLVREVPGIALLTSEGLAVTTDFHHDNSFSYWNAKEGRAKLTVGTPLRDALRSLGHLGDWDVTPNPNSIVQGIERYATVKPVGERALFHRHVSRPRGTQFTLGWQTADAPQVTARGAHRIRRAFVAVNGPVSIKAGVEQFDTAQHRRRTELFARIRARAEARKAAAERSE